jgi:hypothetical protein
VLPNISDLDNNLRDLSPWYRRGKRFRVIYKSTQLGSSGAGI